MNHDDAPLTPAGADRRNALRRDLVRAFEEHHRRRQARRRGLRGAAALLLLAGAAIAVLHGPPAPGPDGVPPSPRPAPPRLAIVHTEPGILDRYRAPARGRIERVDDDGLIRTLRDLGRPAGIIRTGGRVRLTAEVVDADPIEDGSSGVF